MELQEVGRLLFSCEVPTTVTAKPWPIYASQQFDIGRKHVQDLLGIDDSSISSHHLRIRCNIFDEDDTSVSPAVYLEVLTKVGKVNIWTQQHAPACLTHASPTQLLSTGDRISLSRQVSVIFKANSIPQLDTVRSFSSSTDKYILTNRIIGKGASGDVFVATDLHKMRQLACKVICKLRSDSSIADQRALKKQLDIDREVQVLCKADHPNVIQIADVFHESNRIYILQELATGGDLFSYMRLRERLEECEIVVISFQITHAVKYLHDSGIIHRDIKPENILLTSWKPGCRIVLTDFGQARDVHEVLQTGQGLDRVRMQSIVGTEGWAAPELKRDSRMYGAAIDIWSLGCVTLSMFTREMPEDSHQAFILSQTLSQLPSPARRRSLASMQAQSFVRACTSIDTSERMTATAALVHSWFCDPLYAEDLESAYKHAIGSWISRSTQSQVASAQKDTSRYGGHLGSIDEIHASPVSVMSTHAHSKTQYTEGSTTLPTRGSNDVSQSSYSTQATVSVGHALDDQNSVSLSIMDLIPPPSAQVAGLSFSDAPQSLLQSLCETSGAE